jgi:thioredoxin-dependent peroxiredoxin
MFVHTLRVTVVVGVLGLLAVAGTTTADDKKDEKPVDLQVGDVAPKFEARTDQDKTWTSADSYGKKYVVIYFYPGDFTPGCTAQANAFRDGMNKLTELGVEVVGVSGDSVMSHELFRKAQKLNFTLLSDEEGSLAKMFGVPVGAGATVKAKDADGKPIEIKRAVTAARWTFVVGKDGKIAYKNIKVTPADDAKKITEFITQAEGK